LVGPADGAVAGPGTGVARPRKYQRTTRPKGPRLYRTRSDPFADVEAEVEAWLSEHLGRFPDVQLRTLQRKLAKRRAQAVLAFDDGWRAEETLGEEALPRPMRTVVLADEPSGGAAPGKAWPGPPWRDRPTDGGPGRWRAAAPPAGAAQVGR
jgi:hypothetical protein